MVNGDLGHLGEAAVKLVGKVEYEQEVEVVTIHHLSMEGRHVILWIQVNRSVVLLVQHIHALKVR